MPAIAFLALLLAQAAEPGPPPISAYRNLPSGPLVRLSTTPPAERARPHGDLASLVERSDYPAIALRNREQGTVGFWLQVSAEGRVSDCVIASSSRSAMLDVAICRIMRSRARFTPARDASGAAVSDAFSGRYTWQLPPT